MHVVDHDIQGLSRSQTIKARFGVAVFNALHDAGNANLDKLIQIAGGDGEELDPFEQGIFRILGFFEDAAIKAQPRFVAADKETLRILAHIVHRGGLGLPTVLTLSTLLKTQEDESVMKATIMPGIFDAAQRI